MHHCVICLCYIKQSYAQGLAMGMGMLHHVLKGKAVE
jgi:hypothetical protein